MLVTSQCLSQMITLVVTTQLGSGALLPVLRIFFRQGVRPVAVHNGDAGQKVTVAVTATTLLAFWRAKCYPAYARFSPSMSIFFI